MELGSFQQWLQTNHGLKERSAKDVISRIKRVRRIADINFQNPYDEIIETLEGFEGFNKLSDYVKPQLKRAIKLHKEYLQQI